MRVRFAKSLRKLLIGLACHGERVIKDAGFVSMKGLKLSSRRKIDRLENVKEDNVKIENINDNASKYICKFNFSKTLWYLICYSSMYCEHST